MTIRIAMTVNGTEYARDVEPRLLLIHFIRDELGLTGLASSQTTQLPQFDVSQPQ